MTSTIVKQKMFRYIENKDRTFLLGAYRGEKSQLEWILGEKTQRYKKLYNIRYNHDLFSQRNGGVLSKVLPDFILIYNTQNPQEDYHLFPCVNSSVKEQTEMELLEYPTPNGSYIVFSLGEELAAEPLNISKLIKETFPKGNKEILFAPKLLSGKEIANVVDESLNQPKIAVCKQPDVLRFIDLFAGIGGIRCGLELAAKERGLKPICVFTSEIKPYAVKVLQENHPGETITGDITKVHTKNIPDFDILCAGFPCQAFSSAGKRQGFADTRGTMFFEVERILKDKRPKGFILENVEGLVNHNGGKTLQVIADRLATLNYKFDFRVLNSKYFGVPQERKRIYIVGSTNDTPNLDNFPVKESKLGDILETGLPTADTPFIRTLLKRFTIEQLYGKSIKDKRGGNTNIHSWDLEIKGSVTPEQKRLLDTILTERRKKKWAEIIGIDWMDGMPLTLEQIRTCFDAPNLEEMLEDLTKKGYLKFEYPKKLIRKKNENGVVTTHREYDTTKPKGYNIVAGKLSFEINKVMSPKEIAPTLVAMDMQKLYVGDNGGLRRLSLREGLRLCGYPDNIKFNVSEKDGFDLLGNTVVVPVIKAVTERLLDTLKL
ncbi:DNA (cytosine-5-)-methyltransferase [Prevotella bivia]|uniref:DNA (cytosine-5-)-methyltransferase n=1 Tax=Prevotella bivia TaxID=28125 RepID=UPI000B0A26A4|nr:DNA (cytosine-5-)-methyltransferase [Prevotella bivia]